MQYQIRFKPRALKDGKKIPKQELARIFEKIKELAIDNEGNRMVTLHPNILEQEGKKQFVVLPYSEFIALLEELEDFYDLKELREAKKEEGDAPTLSFEEAKKELGLS